MSNLKEITVPMHRIKIVPEMTVRKYRLDKRHVAALRASLKRGAELPPVIVWEDRAGAKPRLVLLDGQHRRKAREEAGETSIRVRVVEGGYDDALHWLGRENGHDALPLSGDERRNYAWRLVQETQLSKRDIVLAAKVSNGLVGEMRKVAKAFAAVSDLQAAPSGNWSLDRHGPGAKLAAAPFEDWDDPTRTVIRNEIINTLNNAPAIRRALKADEDVVFDAIGIAFGKHFIGKLAEYHGRGAEEDAATEAEIADEADRDDF